MKQKNDTRTFLSTNEIVNHVTMVHILDFYRKTFIPYLKNENGVYKDTEKELLVNSYRDIVTTFDGVFSRLDKPTLDYLGNSVSSTLLNVTPNKNMKKMLEGMSKLENTRVLLEFAFTMCANCEQEPEFCGLRELCEKEQYPQFWENPETAHDKKLASHCKYCIGLKKGRKKVKL